MFYEKEKSDNFAAMECQNQQISTYEEALLAIRVAIAAGRDDLLPKLNTMITKNFPASMAQGATEAPLVNGKSVGGQINEVENVSKVDKTEIPEAKQSMILESLNAGQAVQLWDFLKAGFEIADMDASHQREETKKGVSELEKSLVRCKTFYREIELYPAKAYIQGGNGTPYRFDGRPIDISDPDIDRLFVMPDGKQRACAFARVMSQKEYRGKESEFNVKVKMCPADGNLDVYIKELQVSQPWDERTRRKTSMAMLGNTTSGIHLMNRFIEESKMTARGAYKLIFRKDGYNKRLYEETSYTGILHPALNVSPEVTKRAEGDYKSLKIAFRHHRQYLKNSAAVDVLIDVFTSATENPNEAVSMYLDFLTSLLDSDFEKLDAAKSVPEKEQVLHDLFNDFKKNYPDPEYRKEIQKRIEDAKKDYETLANQTEQPKKAKVSSATKYFTKLYDELHAKSEEDNKNDAYETV